MAALASQAGVANRALSQDKLRLLVAEVGHGPRAGHNADRGGAAGTQAGEDGEDGLERTGKER